MEKKFPQKMEKNSPDQPTPDLDPGLFVVDLFFFWKRMGYFLGFDKAKGKKKIKLNDILIKLAILVFGVFFCEWRMVGRIF